MNGHPYNKKDPNEMAILNQIAVLIRARASVNTERGAAMVEYAFLVILIAIIAIVGVQIAGQQVSVAFSTVATGLGSN